MPNPNDKHTNTQLESIDPADLEKVAGGASRVSSKGSEDITAMLTQITSSIKDLAGSKNSGTDPMQMMLIMLMMGGFGGGGGGGGGYAVGAHATPPVINVDTGVTGGGGGCRPKGKKGW